MTVSTIAHVNFDGQARAALDYWAAALGGQAVAVPYGDTAEQPSEAERIIWGQVTTPVGIRLMAYDVQGSLPFDAGTNAFYVSVGGPSAEEVQRVWDGLVEGSQVHQDLGPSSFSPLYGKLTDRFGVTWIIAQDAR